MGSRVAVSPHGHVAYVPIYGNSGVGLPGLDGREMLAIDIPSRQIVGKVDFGRGVRPPEFRAEQQFQSESVRQWLGWWRVPESLPRSMLR